MKFPHCETHSIKAISLLRNYYYQICCQKIYHCLLKQFIRQHFEINFGLPDEELLKMVRDVSEDPVYHTIEFNEFLQLLSKQQRSGTNYDSLKDAFSIFDKDDDGYIPVNEMRDILQSLGDKMTDQELDEMMAAADSDHDGFINYEGM